MEKLAIIRTGGKQYLVREQDKLKVEKLSVEPENTIELETLLIVDGDKIEIGEPILNKKVQAVVKKQGHLPTVIGVKYKRKTRQKTKFGHRQKFTEILIEKI